MSDDAIRILKAGINRFFDEGYYRWSKDTVEKVLSPTSIDDAAVREALVGWAKLGHIRFVGADECYFEVLSPLR